MRRPEEVLRDLVREWVAKATLDYHAAEQLLSAENVLREVVAVHCQQAVEKYLKALLVRHQIEFPKTHNIRQLLDLVSHVAPELASLLEDAATLSPYGVDVRYPGDLPEVLPGQEVGAFEMTARVRAAVMDRLAPLLGLGSD